MTDDTFARRSLLRAGAVTLSLGVAGCSQAERFMDGSSGNGGGGGGQNLRSISIGETRTGVIDQNDGNDPVYGDLSEPVTFDADANQRVVISMESGDVDPYIVLVGPNGDTVAENDDGGSSFNSELTTTLTQGGTYTIWAGSFSGDATGEYTLTLESAGSAGEGRTDLRSIGYGETKQGYIDGGDGSDPQYGDLAEPVTFDARTDVRTVVAMESDDLDPFVLVTDPNGSVVVENDDGGSGFNSQLTTSLNSSGTYTIWAGSFSGDITGPYTLTLELI